MKREKFGQLVRRRRVALGISQSILGSTLSRSQWFISAIERGVVKPDRKMKKYIRVSLSRFEELRRKTDPLGALADRRVYGARANRDAVKPITERVEG